MIQATQDAGLSPGFYIKFHDFDHSLDLGLTNINPIVLDQFTIGVTRQYKDKKDIAKESNKMIVITSKKIRSTLVVKLGFYRS